MKNLRIGLFGHSIATRDPKCPTKGFIDTILEKTESTLVHEGIVCCSTERTLYDLKSLAAIDMAIIFYGNPGFYFAPKLPLRDFDYYTEVKFGEKILAMRGMKIENVEETKIENQANEIFFKGTHINREEFISALKVYNKWFYNQKLQQNRHEGALVLIDQYLLYKKIPAVHCINKNWPLPTWFNFQSGVIENEFYAYQNNQYREHRADVSSNNINQEGNDIIAEKLMPLMQAAIQKAA